MFNNVKTSKKVQTAFSPTVSMVSFQDSAAIISATVVDEYLVYANC